ncbi:hypothetical protein GCM10007147_23280 [Nocardiopsis kunsanensis]|uniref:Uncharacterized protein n=1 Tax=Nocardiopsis kunsanensis TaxID=141693 RepID=A0A919CHL3_9ACTN|nr:hypothetical protein [Nocardiopsis kunsanensis]GHD25812.1 hypothetical protein GCM10007147_23280 [Nocardiopsis kunsanensis]
MDPFAFAAVVTGCAALYWCRARPVAALAVSTAAFVFFLWRDHELGLFLAPMAALYATAVHGAPRAWPLAAVVAGVGASLLWVHRRVAEVAEPGAALLAWVAFPTVILVFLAGSYAVGELVRCHRELAAGPVPECR